MHFYVSAPESVLDEIASIEVAVIERGLAGEDLTMDDLETAAEEMLHRLSANR